MTGAFVATVWQIGLCLSILSVVLGAVLAFVLKGICRKKGKKLSIFHILFAGVAVGCFFMFLPVGCGMSADSGWGFIQTFFLTLFHATQIFTIGTEFAVVLDYLPNCPAEFANVYQIWASVLFVAAPVFTFGVILTLFRNLSAQLRYLRYYFRDAYIFSELNERALILAKDLKAKNPKAVIVFTDVFVDNEETAFELSQRAKAMGAVCFKKDILVVNFAKHSPKKELFFFTIGENETENLNQAQKLIETYRDRENTHLYIFCVKVESELLLTAVDKGRIKVRRVNEVQSLISRVLYEDGDILFQTAKGGDNGVKNIGAVVVGMGNHGTEMVKALTWFCQMDGYRVRIDAFDVDPLAEDKFIALAPELMSEKYNGVELPGEARYRIAIHSGLDVLTRSFADEIGKLTDTTYVLVALGSDEMNIKTAVTLRMLFERMHIHPVIQAIVHNSQQKQALQGIRNYRGQPYDIDFIGDLESCYQEKVILDSALEAEALQRHLKWGQEDEFWSYEYNYRSSVAAAIHRKARLHRGIPGADKKEAELTDAERESIETLEHRRWNAYMRAEGYVYSGSKEKSSRNDLAKMHHDLVDYASLTEEEKRKDSRVGTQ